MLFSIFPHAFISCSINMNVNSETVSFIIYPAAIIDVAINVHEFTLSIRSVVFPIPFVSGAIRPNLFAITISETTSPLSSIFSSRFELISWFNLSFGVGIIKFVRNSFSLLFKSKIFAISSFCLPNKRNLLSS